MQSYLQNLISLLTGFASDLEERTSKLMNHLPARDLAGLFAHVSFLITSLEFVQGQYWSEEVKNDKNDHPFSVGHFIKKYFKIELRPLLFFQSTLENATIEDIKHFQKNALFIQKSISSYVKAAVLPRNHEFALAALTTISELFEFEHQMIMKKEDLNQNLNYSLYRTFDALDECFDLNYNSEHSDAGGNTAERIYLQSGVAVQSSYATLLMALRYVNIPNGSRFVDLGSGFGRVGLVLGLLRPDVQFTGYEFVANRVHIAEAASKKLGLSSQTKFYQQDLSSKDFAFPEAETYYLYDPFTEETYSHIVDKLNEIASRKKINVITKGNAKIHFLNTDQKRIWSKPQEFLTANFCLFRSN